ncbi:MAG: DUF4440 domain-containing protein [Gemmatimonadota bacterium]
MIRFFASLATAIPLLAVSLGAQSTSSTSGAVRTAIDRGNAEYIAAFAQPNPEALARVYDSAGARLSPNGAYSRGRAAIAAEVRDFVSKVGPVRVTLETTDLWAIGDLAYETGKWSYTFTPQSKRTATIGGRYVTVWRLQADGNWRMLADLGVPGTSMSGSAARHTGAAGWRHRTR